MAGRRLAENQDAEQTYHPLDRTHRQIVLEAFRIVTRNGGIIEPGQREDRTPKFRGLEDSWWQALYDNNPRDFFRLIVLCRRDFPTFAALLGKIVSRLDKKRTPLIFNNGQQIVWNKKAEAIEAGRMPFLVVLKARQFGISAQGMMEDFWHMWGHDDVQSVNVSHDETLEDHLIAFYSLFYESLPKIVDAAGDPVRQMRPALRSRAKDAAVSKGQLEFPQKNCVGVVLNAKKAQPRGMSASRISLRECAFYPDLDDFWGAIEPQLPSIGTSARLRCSVMFETTPNGENAFFRLWQRAKDPETEMIPVFLPWFIHDDEYTAKPPAGWRMSAHDVVLQAALTESRKSIDGRVVTRDQMYWRHRKIEDNEGGVDWFDREYPSDDQTCFLMRSSSAFASEMKYMVSTAHDAETRGKKLLLPYVSPAGIIERKPLPCTVNLDYPRLASPFNGVSTVKFKKPRVVPGGSGLWIYETPERERTYMIGADSAGGQQNRDSSSAFVIDLKTGRQVAEFDGKMGPEDYADFLVHLCTWYNMAWIMPESNGFGGTVIERMSKGWRYPNICKEDRSNRAYASTRSSSFGFFTSPQTRPIMLANLKYMIENRYVAIASRAFIGQAATMKKIGDDDYRTVKHKQPDDRIIAAALACIAVRQNPGLFAGLYSAQQERVPTAVDLGLSHQEYEPTDDDGLKRKLGAAGFESIFGEDEFPWNPMGFSGMLDF